MNPYNVSLLCFAFCSLLLGLLVWFRRRDEIGNKYLILSTCYAGWAFFVAINLSESVNYDWALFAGRFSNGIAVFIPPVWFHFVNTFIGEKNKHRTFVKFLYGVSLLIACFMFSAWFIPNVVPRVGFEHYPVPGPAFHIFSVLFFTVVPLSFFELFKKIKATKGQERQQYKGFFWTALIGYFGGGLTFFPIYGIPLPQYGLFLMPVYPFALTYFMIKQKLFDAEEFAQAAHRDKLTAIGVLAASINHEVRNPLFVIHGLAESCLERQTEGVFKSKEKALESANDAMRRSMEQSQRAMDIIKRLSLFAKAGIESEIKFESIKLSAVLEDILPLVRYELAEHSIALVREIPENLPSTQADRRYLEEVLFNLVVNAMQAIKEGEKAAEIRIRAWTEGEKVLIAISDNGPGIPEDKIKDVFRPFYTTKEEGTGLGLYITKQLVEKVRGRIDVKSEAGKGTVFIVALTTSAIRNSN